MRVVARLLVPLYQPTAHTSLEELAATAIRLLSAPPTVTLLSGCQANSQLGVGVGVPVGGVPVGVWVAMRGRNCVMLLLGLSVTTGVRVRVKLNMLVGV